MKTPIGKEKIIAGVAAIILLLAVVTSVYYINTNSSLKSGLNGEKLRNESLLSEKLALEKEIMQFKQDIDMLNGKSAQTDKLLAEARIKLTEKEKAMAGLNKENASVKSLKKQVAELKEMHEDFIHQVTAIKMQNENLKSENQQLQNSIATLQNERNELMKQVEIAKAESIQRADNYQVDVFKNVKNEKPTVRAKRMRMMSVIIDVPKDIASGVGFNLITPDGQVITEKSKNLSWKVVNNNSLLASINPFDDQLIVTNRVKLSYTPTAKMKPGIYKIGILNRGKNIGNCRVRLQ